MMNASHRMFLPRLLVLLGCCSLFAAVSTDVSSAQDRRFGNRGENDNNDGNRRGPGNFGSPRGNFSFGVTGSIFRDEARAELGIDDATMQKLGEVMQNARGNPDDMREMFERSRNAQTDEEREKIREEMTKAFQERAKKTEDEIAKVIGEEKMVRLRQVHLQFEGARALQQDDVAKDLNISEDQKAKIAELMEQRGEARRELGFNASPEDRAKFDREWNDKVFGILNDEQKKIWSDKVGGVIVDTGIPGTRTPLKNPLPSQNSSATSRPSVTTNYGSTVIRPDGEVEGQLASFDPMAPNAVNRAEFPAADANSGDKPKVVGFGDLPKASKEKMSFNFRYAPWADVLQMFSKLAGLTLDMTFVPPGTFNYYDEGEYTAVEALDILNGYLIQKGYTLLRRDQFLVVVNMDNGIPPNLIELVSLEELKDRGRFEFLQIRIPLKGIEADVAAREAEALLGSHGKVVPLRTSNSLLITDIGDNLRAITQLLESVTTEEDPSEIIFQQFVLQHIDSLDAENLVRSQFGLPRGATNVSSTFERSRDSSSSNAATRNMSVVSDARTNSLLINAPRSTMKLVESLIKALDVDDGTGLTRRNRNSVPYLKVYVVQNANPREVTKTLSALIPGVVVNEDGDSRKIHIVATEEEHAEISAMIKELDNDGGEVTLFVYPLSKLDPAGVAMTLNSMFAADAELAPTIEPDPFGRRLMIRASHDQAMEIKAFLLQLGEDGTGVLADNEGRGRIRTMDLGGRDPSELLEMLDRVWKQSKPNPIRIVIPSEPRNPVRSELVPSAETRPATPTPARTTDGGQAERDAAEKQSNDAAREELLRQFEALLSGSGTDDDSLSGADEQPATNQPSKSEADALLNELERRLGQPSASEKTPAATDDASNPITVIQQGDRLIITSNDEKALDQLEELIREIGMALPPQTNWTLFYLRTADATEVAYMLEQLIPDSNVSASSFGSESSSLFGGLTNSIMGLGDTLADASGLSTLGNTVNTLRIVPDIRLNALFVTGPSNLVAEVEQFLKILDASELPDSLRDRVPRAIDVLYADVNDVYEDVKSLYGEYMTSSAQQDRNNPLAMLLGNNNRNSGRNTRVEMAKLALSVDEKSSKLIVSANDSLFREIESVVQTMDQSAKDSRQTVQVIHLQHADPLSVQQTLTSLLPKVRIATSGETRRTETRDNNTSNNNQNTGSRDNNRDNNNDAQEQMRRMMEQRMRDQFQQRGQQPQQQQFQFPGSNDSNRGNTGRSSFGRRR